MSSVLDLGQAIDALRRGDLDLARAAAESAVGSSPSPQWRHLLGLIHCRSGKPEEGVEHLEAALDSEPSNVAYRIMLVRALIDCGRADEGLAYALRPVSGPAAADLWRLRAEVAAAAGSIGDREEALRNLELIKLESQLASAPGNRALLLQRARLLAALQQQAKAEETYRKLLAAGDTDADALRELGQLLERQNRIDELRALVRDAEAAEADPQSLALLKALLAWRERRPDAAQRWLSQAELTADPLAYHHLEMKIEDALGNPDPAFRAAEAINAAVSDRAEWREAARSFRSDLRANAHAVTADWAECWTPVVAEPRETPVFLVGFPRSGTTLFDTFLAGHPDIYVLEEIPIVGSVAEKIGSVKAVAELEESRTEQLRGVYSRAIRRQLPPGFGGLTIDKLPLNMLWAPLIHRLFPAAKFLFAQRHPCDCVLSCFFQNFALNPAMANFLDLFDAADFYDAAMDMWTRSAAFLPLHIHRVRYEELVAQPEATLRPVLEFLGVEWRAELINHQTTAEARGFINTPSYDQVTQPLTQKPVGRWRRYEEQLQPVLPILLPWAEQFGYEA